MAHPFHHAQSSARKFGGKPEDYQRIHDWFDETKAHFADCRHRAMRHHSEGIYLCESIFGVAITNSAGKQVPVRIIGEQHVKEDMGFIPTMADWLRCMPVRPWMFTAARHGPKGEDADQAPAERPTTGAMAMD